MPKIAYLDCPTGISGDMCLGALVHGGVPLDYLREQLAGLGIGAEYKLWAEPVSHQGQMATKVHVNLTSEVDAAPESAASNLDHPPDHDHEHLDHSHDDRHDHDHHDHHDHRHDRDPQGPDSELTPTGTHLPQDFEAQIPSPEDPYTTPDPDHTPISPSSTALHNHPHSHSHSHNHSHNHPEGRKLKDIQTLIEEAPLPKNVKQWSLAIFRNLAIAEGAVHGVPPEMVHFHEVGATDAIVDIVGTCLGLDWLKIRRLYCSPLPTGGGTVWAAHGRMAVPVPAVLKLWEMAQVPVYSNGINHELVTPTGAAIVTTLATQFGPPPSMQLSKIGLGAGTRTLPIANVLRLWIGKEGGKALDSAKAGKGKKKADKDKPSKSTTLSGLPSHLPSHLSSHLSSHLPSHLSSSELFSQVAINSTTDSATETITLLQTQLDDLSPQAIGYVFEQLQGAGALDVFTQAIGMKKCRPGILLTVICAPDRVAACEAILFRETTTLGIRRLNQTRTVLHREIQTVDLPQGSVRVKVAWSMNSPLVSGSARGEPLNVQPEYEDCAAIARQHNLPWQTIHQAALQAWQQQHSPNRLG